MTDLRPIPLPAFSVSLRRFRRGEDVPRVTNADVIPLLPATALLANDLRRKVAAGQVTRMEAIDELIKRCAVGNAVALRAIPKVK